MFTNFTWKKFIFVIIAALALAVSGMAVRYGEDGQVGSSHVVSIWFYSLAVLTTIYGMIVLLIMILRCRTSAGNKKEN